MCNLKPIISSQNVDAVFINGKYQDESKSLTLNKEDIKYYHCSVTIITSANENIEISFHSVEELIEFAKAYELK